jgi:hypothetical protein
VKADHAGGRLPQSLSDQCATAEGNRQHDLGALLASCPHGAGGLLAAGQHDDRAELARSAYQIVRERGLDHVTAIAGVDHRPGLGRATRCAEGPENESLGPQHTAIVRLAPALTAIVADGVVDATLRAASLTTWRGLKVEIDDERIEQA